MYSSTITQLEERKKKPEVSMEKDVEPVQLSNPTPAVYQALIWRNVIGLAVLHGLAIYSLATHYHLAKKWTWVWTPTYGIISGLGITAGAHRLWAHRSYSAKLPLRIFLAYLYCMAGQTCISKWVRDHRTHHRYTETKADPHDANRGFFFSHVGWLMMRRHPAVKEYGSKVDMSDVHADPVVQFADKYYEFIMGFLCFVLPSLVPVYGWGETWYISIHAVIIRYMVLLHLTFLVNSFAHMWGNRPYNRNVRPTENPWVAFFALGEGWHNYHHSFPWDYKAAELGGYGLNVTTCFIETMAWLGLAYDLKTPSERVVERTSVKKGDGSQSMWGRPWQQNRHS